MKPTTRAALIAASVSIVITATTCLVPTIGIYETALASSRAATKSVNNKVSSLSAVVASAQTNLANTQGQLSQCQGVAAQWKQATQDLTLATAALALGNESAYHQYLSSASADINGVVTC
jgi:hypothetical protein